MKLKQLFKGLPVQIKGNKEVVIRSLSSHSTRVVPGGLFISKKGRSTDGARFLSDAVQAGAVALLTDLYNPFLAKSAQVIALDIAQIEPLIANRYYRFPSKELFAIGVTGTDGKTTTAYIIKHLLGATGDQCGLIGTIECDLGYRCFSSELTTPDLVTNQSLLREMVDNGVKSVVMEVSSHGLDQGRVEGIDFDGAVFTNLGSDHLDYHKTLDRYLLAKARLFSSIDKKGKFALINRDDNAFESLRKLKRARVVSYGMDQRADLSMKVISQNLTGMVLEISFFGKRFSLTLPLIGTFNGYNALAAIGVALLKGIDIKVIKSRLETLPPIPGRMEQIDSCAPFSVFVDFAHTAQALERVLSELKAMCCGRLIVLFGAGGDRDRGKRPLMARAAKSHANYLIITSDNPRSEDPNQIIAEICAALGSKKEVITEPNRRLAIRHAFKWARKGDIVLIAGRGHELRQKIGKLSIPFDDRQVAREELAPFL